MSTPNPKLGQAFRKARKERKLSLRAAAAAANLDRDTVRQLERGKGTKRTRSIYGRLLKLSLCWTLALNAACQDLVWEWPTDACGAMLTCDTGAFACDLPAVHPLFAPLPSVWHCAGTCPAPDEPGDTFVRSWGWEGPGDTTLAVVQLSAQATAPLYVDSVDLRARSGVGGPQWVQVYANGFLLTTLYGSQFWGSYALPFGLYLGAGDVLRITLAPYYASGGVWELDRVRAVCTPDASTSIGDHPAPERAPLDARFDVLGRSCSNAFRGVVVAGGRKIVVP